MTIIEISRILRDTSQNFHKALVQYLAHGGDINAKDQHGWPLIVTAAEQGNLEIVKLLVEQYSADPTRSVEDKSWHQGYTALHACASLRAIKDQKLIDLLGLIDLLIEHGAKINAKTAIGETPLNFAVRNFSAHSSKIVKKLVAHHADVNIVNWCGNPPIVDATSQGSDSMIRFLINARADLEALLKYPTLTRSNTPAYEASIKKYRPKLFEILKECDYIIPSPSNPYDPQTEQEIDKHNLQVMERQRVFYKFELYRDIKNIIYSYLYSDFSPPSRAASEGSNTSRLLKM